MTMTMKFRPRRQQAGMTLLEVLVSVLIVSFGILGLVALHARASQFSVDAEDRTRAAMLADELISTIWNTRTLSLPAGEVTAWKNRVADPVSGGLPNGLGDVSVVGQRVSVQIRWTPPYTPGSERQYQTTVEVAF